MYLNCDGCRFDIQETELVITSDELCLTRLKLVPWIEGMELKVGKWSEFDANHLFMPVTGFGSLHLAVREGHVCYWIETGIKHFKKLVYFPGSQPVDKGWHTFVSDELDRYWSIDENADVPVSSAYVDMHVDREDGAGMTDPGDKPPTWIWNIPPRALSIDTCKGWIGLCIPGPLSNAVTRFKMYRGVFDIAFEELRPCAVEWGPPRVYFIPLMNDPYNVLDHQRLISEMCGLTLKNTVTHPDWWTYPSFKCADEVHRMNKGEWAKYDENGKSVTSLSTGNLLQWIEHVNDYAGLNNNLNIQIDQSFLRGYGCMKVVEPLGGNEGLRGTIDMLREKGIRTGLYLHLYMIDPKESDFPAKHPEAVCKRKDPSTRVWSGCKIGSQNMDYIDWTHPLGRQHMLDIVEWLLSDKPGCLNADWLLMNNNMGVDPRKFHFHDPDWGTGDLMSMKALKLVYEHAKKIKPDCLVRRQSPGDAYMQPYFDQANLCEEWNGQTTAWYRRMNIATRILDNCIFHMDAWFVTLTKLAEYYFALAAVCPPEIESVRHAIHPYMYYREMRQKDYRRIKAGVQTYNNAPVRKDDTCFVNYKGDGQPGIWRRRNTGPLAGWYASIALDKRCFVTYSKNEARVAASRELRVSVPLPPGKTLKSVEAVPHGGQPYEYEYAYEMVEGSGGNSLRLWVPDSGDDIMLIRIRY